MDHMKNLPPSRAGGEILHMSKVGGEILHKSKTGGEILYMNPGTILLGLASDDLI